MPERYYERTWFLFLLITLVIALAASYFWILYSVICSSGDRGEFGDAFGGINALFTGLAFAGVIFGIILQRREIRIQQRELASTRSIFTQQSFETTFFNLQRLLSETISPIEWRSMQPDPITGRYETLTGRAALQAIVATIYEIHGRKLLMKVGPKNPQPDYDTQLEWLLETYSEFYESHESMLGNYFRLVYNILKYVELSEFPAEEKERYAHYFRAQLSEGELSLLVLNGMTKRGVKMARFLEEFAMLKHATMEGRAIPNPKKQYRREAFVDLAER